MSQKSCAGRDRESGSGIFTIFRKKNREFTYMVNSSDGVL